MRVYVLFYYNGLWWARAVWRRFSTGDEDVCLFYGQTKSAHFKFFFSPVSTKRCWAYEEHIKRK